MKGARKYAELFETGRYGKLYLISGRHARGRTFSILVLPKNEPICCPPQATPNAVEVFGVINGQIGRDETYGWIHHGKWEQDFAALVSDRIDELAHQAQRVARIEISERERIEKLLAEY